MNKEQIKEAILGKEDERKEETPLCQFATFHPDMEMVEILLKGADIQNLLTISHWVRYSSSVSQTGTRCWNFFLSTSIMDYTLTEGWILSICCGYYPWLKQKQSCMS